MFVNMGLVFWFMLGDTWDKQNWTTKTFLFFSAIDPKICINCLRIWFYDLFFGILLSVSFITVIWITRIDFMVAKVHSLVAHVSLKIRFGTAHILKNYLIGCVYDSACEFNFETKIRHSYVKLFRCLDDNCHKNIFK